MLGLHLAIHELSQPLIVVACQVMLRAGSERVRIRWLAAAPLLQQLQSDPGCSEDTPAMAEQVA